jgi:hypothetical protein
MVHLEALTVAESRAFKHFLNAFDFKRIPKMVRICREYPRIFHEAFFIESDPGICQTAIVHAIAIQDVDMVKALVMLLVEWGIDPTIVNDIDNGSPSSTLLIKVAEYSSFYILRNLTYLVGKDVNAKDCNGYTALTMLVKGSIEPERNFDDMRIYFDDMRISTLVMLLTLGADVSIPDPVTGKAPLFTVCYQTKPGAVKTFLEAGINPFTLNEFGCTPREDALFNGVDGDNDCIGFLKEVEDRIIRVRNEARDLSVMMGLHNRLGEASRFGYLDPPMVRQFILGGGDCHYTRFELSNMSEELAPCIKESVAFVTNERIARERRKLDAALVSFTTAERLARERRMLDAGLRRNPGP